MINKVSHMNPVIKQENNVKNITTEELNKYFVSFLLKEIHTNTQISSNHDFFMDLLNDEYAEQVSKQLKIIDHKVMKD